MGAFDYFKSCITKKYADFDGRARRSEYWYFALCYFIILLPVYFIFFMAAFADSTFLTILSMGILVIFGLGMIIPSIAVAVRRLHDIGKSGWMLLLGIIPLVGPILLLVWYCTDSQPGSNEYGPNPKEPSDNLSDHLV